MFQSGYFPIIWMNHNRSLINNINRIHKRALRIVYWDKKSTFKELLKKNGSVIIRLKKIQVLGTEMFKVQDNNSPEIMNKVFPINEAIYEYDLRNAFHFAACCIKTVRYGSEYLSYLRPRLWNILADEYKKLQSVKDRSDQVFLKTAPVSCVKYIFNI